MVRFRCHGCGAEVDAGVRLAFRCPNAGVHGNDVDHVLVVEDGAVSLPIGSEADPFLRYRTWLSPYRLARSAGLPNAAWGDLVGRLDDALTAIDGRGFRVTPMVDRRPLAEALGLPGALWVKDETRNVSGSHKARHLMGVMLYLRVLEAARLPAGENLKTRRLAIASCGNAALAAAIVARAAEWPLDVFIPPDADASVKARLKELGAQVAICDRRPGEAGDPCYLRFREAVAAGAIPFGVQGTDNGLAIEGGRTLAFEMAEEFSRIGHGTGCLVRASRRRSAGECAGARLDAGVRKRPAALASQAVRRSDGRLRAVGTRLGTPRRRGPSGSGAKSITVHVALGNDPDEPRARHSR